MDFRSTDPVFPIAQLESAYALARYSHLGCLRDA
jgi:hypothetical protein